MTRNLKETLETSIYTPKHTKTTKSDFILFLLFSKIKEKSKKLSSKISAFYPDLYDIIYIVEGQTA